MTEPKNRKNAPKPPSEVSAELGAVARAIIAVQVDVDFGKITTREELQAASGDLLRAMERLSDAKFQLWRAMLPLVSRPSEPEGEPMPYDPLSPARVGGAE